MKGDPPKLFHCFARYVSIGLESVSSLCRFQSPYSAIFSCHCFVCYLAVCVLSTIAYVRHRLVMGHNSNEPMSSASMLKRCSETLRRRCNSPGRNTGSRLPFRCSRQSASLAGCIASSLQCCFFMLNVTGPDSGPRDMM